MFRKVIYDPDISTDIARVNRQTGTLYLNPAIWNRLQGLEKEYVLLHESGHLELNTASEFKANKYAVDKFAQVQTLSNTELGKRIQVLAKITDPGNYTSGNFATDALNAVNDTLKIVGVGSKNRIKEQEAAAKLESDKAANTQKIVIISGMLIVVGMVLFFVFKK